MATITGDGIQTVLTGTDEADEITGAGIGETLIGLQGDDTLTGGGGDDLIQAGPNPSFDHIFGSAGSDTIDVDPTAGGATPDGDGFDFFLLDYADLGGTIDVSYTVDVFSVLKSLGGTDTVINLDSIRGMNGIGFEAGAGDDDINLGDSALWFAQINPGGGDDVIDGGTTFTRLAYYDAPAGITVNVEGRTDDGMFGTVQDGQGGTDTFSNVNEVRLSPNADTFNGGGGRDTIIPDGGDDVIDGGDERDRIRFDRGGGADDLVVDGAAGTATGEWEGEAFSLTFFNIEEIFGSSGADVLNAGGALTRLNGLAGDDIIRFNGGSGDGMRGRVSNGVDVYDFADGDVQGNEFYALDGFDISGGMELIVANGTGTLDKGADGEDELQNVDQIGDALSFEGGAGDDRYVAGLNEGQAAIFRGRGGDDTFEGGDAFDILRFDFDATVGVTVDITSGQGEEISGTAVDPFADTDTFMNIDRVDGTRRDDVLNGGASDDSFVTNQGDDQVDGAGGFDIVAYNRSGVDRVLANLGSGEVTNVWDGETFTDTLSNVEQVRGSRGGNDVMTGSGRADQFHTYDGNDVARGNGGADDIQDFGFGADRFFGGAGGDFMRGGLGSDLLDGGRGNDDLGGGAGGDEIKGGGGRDSASGGKGNDRMTGDAGADQLMGDQGKDRIDGGGGNDVIDGGKQNDRLEGGKGRDIFVFDRGDGKNDVILDWDPRDRVRFDSGPDDFGDLKIQNKGKDVLVRYGGKDKFKILGVEPEELQANDFLFA
ncbi:MAG: calcium-binding protein [Pseudomonadota bacterium]